MSAGRIALAVLALASGCVQPSEVACADGTVCAEGTVCVDAYQLCVLPAQVTACEGVAEGAACDDGAGTCFGSACLPRACGNARIDHDEMCDDGNRADRDGCAASCQSTEVCGNTAIDPLQGERCDDGDRFSSDGCDDACQPERATWLHLLASAGPVSGAAATYDPHRQRVVVFGGNTLIGIETTRTLEWDGAWWHDLTPTNTPSPRSGAMLAYDAARREAVLFGGADSGVFRGDTWAWDGRRWVDRTPAGASPPARVGAIFVHDPARGRTLLFGGNGGVPLFSPLDDTWAWDGTRWTELIGTARPPAGDGASGAYDPRRGVVVVVAAGQTWEHDGQAWRQRTTSGPPGRYHGAMAHDVAGQRMILWGGTGADTRAWAWDGATWTDLGASTGPVARGGHVMTPAPDGRLLVTGGSTSSLRTFPSNAAANVDGATWLFDGVTWSIVLAPTPRAGAAIAADPARQQVLLFGGRAPAPADDAWALTARGWREIATGPEGRADAALGCLPDGSCVLFGGEGEAGLLGDTWRYDGTAWTLPTLAIAPGARTRAAVATDATRVVIAGGRDASGGPLADAWAWDGAAWQRLPDLPRPLAGAALGHDPVRDQLVLIGGEDGTGARGDTLVLTGTGWVAPATAAPQAPRVDATLAWDPARRALVVSGGASVTPLPSLAWDGTTWLSISTSAVAPRRRSAGAFSPFDGAGAGLLGGADGSTFTDDAWVLRWDGDRPREACATAADVDGDGLPGCADPDCFATCAPACAPGLTCPPDAPRCGDGTCDPGEACRTCGDDCGACAPVCGDLVCDPGEAGCPGDCS